MLISFIIPIYNVSPYLRKCLDSVNSQGLAEDDYEVIMVNDGSTDSSPEICREYALNYKNFRLINQDNSGLSAARNSGLSKALGQYVFFVDSDDYLVDGSIAAVLTLLGNKLFEYDVVRFYSSYQGEKLSLGDSLKIELKCCGHDYLKRYKGSMPGFCWLYLISRSFLEQHNLYFKQYIIEDIPFTYSLFLSNPRVVSVNQHVYTYVLRSGNLTSKLSKEHCMKLLSDYIDTSTFLLEKADRYGDEYLRQAILFSLRSKSYLYSRSLSASMNYEQFVAFKNKVESVQLYPFHYSNRRIEKVLNFIFHYFPIYKLSSIAYIYLGQPFISHRRRMLSKA